MKIRRRKQYIDSAVQGALVRRIALHWLLFFAVALVVLPFWQVLRSGDFFGPFSRLMLDGLAETAPVLVILLAMIPLFVWDTVKLSNRFTGPMYRFHKTVQGLAAGEDVQPVRLRNGDFWKDVAEDFNAMLERLAAERKQDAPEPDPEPVTCGTPDSEGYAPDEESAFARRRPNGPGCERPTSLGGAVSPLAPRCSPLVPHPPPLPNGQLLASGLVPAVT